MKIDKRYIQVLVSKDNRSQIIYIPIHLAKQNIELKIQNIDGSWEYGWYILNIYNDSIRNDIPNVAQIIRRHRDNTLDSQHKIKKDK